LLEHLEAVQIVFKLEEGFPLSQVGEIAVGEVRLVDSLLL
jgi:hypothetical protein